MKDKLKIELSLIKKELNICNKRASKFFKQSLTYKHAYRELQKSSAWTTAKDLLLRYTFLTKGKLICYLCEKPLHLNRATMHHTKYKHRKIFHPKYITFVHPQCHSLYHRKYGNPTRVRIFISFYGMRIYTKYGRIIIPLWCLMSTILFCVILFFINAQVS